MLKFVTLAVPLFVGVPQFGTAPAPEGATQGAVPETAAPDAALLLPGEKDKFPLPGTGQSYDMAVGTWQGTVHEIGVDPYTITLTLDPVGIGEVTYSGYDCGGLLSPVRQGGHLRYRETITTGRENCADGDVRIVVHGGEMTWFWFNEFGEAQAEARLTRQ